VGAGTGWQLVSVGTLADFAPLVFASPLAGPTTDAESARFLMHAQAWATDESIAAVRNGEAVAVFADKDFLAPIVAESNGELTFVGEEVQLGGGVGLGLRESDAELKEKFNAAIQSMKDDGSLNALIEKHFGPETAKF